MWCAAGRRDRWGWHRERRWSSLRLLLAAAGDSRGGRWVGRRGRCMLFQSPNLCRRVSASGLRGAKGLGSCPAASVSGSSSKDRREGRRGSLVRRVALYLRPAPSLASCKNRKKRIPENDMFFRDHVIESRGRRHTIQGVTVLLAELLISTRRFPLSSARHFLLSSAQRFPLELGTRGP